MFYFLYKEIELSLKLTFNSGTLCAMLNMCNDNFLGREETYHRCAVNVSLVDIRYRMQLSRQHIFIFTSRDVCTSKKAISFLMLPR